MEEVLIIGAGPTGLVLALWLTHFGIPLRIIDRNSQPGETSRAVVVHARTLEFYQQLGFAAEVVAKGIPIKNINIRNKETLATTVGIEAIGTGVSPFPFILSYPQDDHEKLLIAHLEQAGVFVERNTELVSFTQDSHAVIATMKKQDTIETITVPFLFGCDGASSITRTQSEIGFPGGTYQQIFYVADVMATGAIVNGDLQLCMHDTEFSLAFPVRSSGSIRLIGIVPKEKQNKEHIEFSDVEAAVIRDTQIDISKVNWFSTYHSHHRVADHFKKGRIFLLGDAGHIHSPVGGQGMNTGIGDAVNLAWKIAAVMHNRATPKLLDSYELERMTFARQLIATTDRVFKAVTNPGLLGRFSRTFFFPHVVPFFTKFNLVKHFLFNTVSQVKINYHNSPLSEGKARKIKGGDRLPWVKDDLIDNFKSLELMDWQIHIYGQVREEFKSAITISGLHLSEYGWNDKAHKAGLEQNAAYLIRPDGYVAFASSFQDSDEIKNFLYTYKIKPFKASIS